MRPDRLIRTGLLLAAAGVVATPALAHDPRTTARILSQTLLVEDEGEVTLEYRALHFNQEMYDRARSTPDFMAMLNDQVWGRMGDADVGFDLVSGGRTVPEGEYELGINMTASEGFSVVLWQDDKKLELPLAVEKGATSVPYLALALLATDKPDVFVLEARCGPYRGTVEVQAPSLGADHPHEHDDEEDDE